MFIHVIGLSLSFAVGQQSDELNMALSMRQHNVVSAHLPLLAVLHHYHDVFSVLKHVFHARKCLLEGLVDTLPFWGILRQKPPILGTRDRKSHYKENSE